MNSALPLSEFRKEVVYIGAVDDGRVGGIERINGLALDGVECACYTVIAHLVSADIDRCGDRAFLDRRCTRDTAEAADNLFSQMPFKPSFTASKFQSGFSTCKL